MTPSTVPSLSCRIFFFQAEDGIRDLIVTGVQTCALPIFEWVLLQRAYKVPQMHQSYSHLLARHRRAHVVVKARSEEHTSELQSRSDLICPLLLEKKKKKKTHQLLKEDIHQA